jgi:hypothetical protein
MDMASELPEAAQAETPALTNLEVQRRCQQRFLDNANFYLKEGQPDRAAFWMKLVNACQVDIDGILASSDDCWIPF